jgi:hypothetical protein
VFKRLVNWAAIAALCGALAFGVLWFSDYAGRSSTWEAGATVLALFAALAGLPGERWAAARERRASARKAVLRERDENLAVLQEYMVPMTLADARRRVYPRLLTSALTMAIASGEFGGRSDEPILAAMLACQDDITQLNHRLDLLEQRMFLTASVSPRELVDLDRPLYRPDGYVAEVRAALEGLVNAWRPPRTGPFAWRRPGRSRP